MAGTSENLSQIIAQQQEEINYQLQTIDNLHTLMKQLLERSDKRKRSKHCKKKRTPTMLGSSKEEEDLNHDEVTSKHSNHLGVSESSAQKMAEFKKRLEAIANRDKLRETRYD